jgi:hypothetical protein
LEWHTFATFPSLGYFHKILFASFFGLLLASLRGLYYSGFMIDVLTAYLANNDGTGVTQLTTTHTGRPGPHRTVYMVAMLEGAGDIVSSCTYAGGAMRKRAGVGSATAGNRIELWELCDEVDAASAIPTSSNSVVVNFSSSTSAWIGVVQVNGMLRAVADTSTDNHDSGTVYVNYLDVDLEDTLVLDMFCGGSTSTITPNNSQNTIFYNSSIASMCIFWGWRYRNIGTRTHQITCGTTVSRGVLHSRANRPYPSSLPMFGG